LYPYAIVNIAIMKAMTTIQPMIATPNPADISSTIYHAYVLRPVFYKNLLYF